MRSRHVSAGRSSAKAQACAKAVGGSTTAKTQGDDARPPESWETGFKDSVIAYPGEIPRVKALFDLLGFYVWHCHIVEHEDNEMMRPRFIGPNPPTP